MTEARTIFLPYLLAKRPSLFRNRSHLNQQSFLKRKKATYKIRSKLVRQLHWRMQMEMLDFLMFFFLLLLYVYKGREDTSWGNISEPRSNCAIFFLFQSKTFSFSNFTFFINCQRSTYDHHMNKFVVPWVSGVLY